MKEEGARKEDRGVAGGRGGRENKVKEGENEEGITDK